MIRWYRAKRRRHRRAFTLIELMITVSIIGVLASIAVARYENFVCNTQQAEARIGLRNIYDVETEIFGTHGVYLGVPSCTFGYAAACVSDAVAGVPTFTLEFKGRSRFSYSVDATPTGFLAYAVGTTGAVLGSEVTLNHDGAFDFTGSTCK